MARFVCIHGHFYQPPRENPWLDEVEPQESAWPYHDWNERITAECYAPNADARILDGAERITRIVNNYRRMSFNFGPTLLGWLEAHDAGTHRAIVDADRESRERFSGHGSALAQAYGHAILPLANARDKRTQVLWGVRDFARRFGRDPEGMWLPETAADSASLEALADAGVAFTILAPSQAAAVRPVGARVFKDVSGGRVDSLRPYRVTLPSGKSLAVIFYDGALSGAVAFGGLLSRGDEFVRRMLGALPQSDRGAPLLTIATDGETYGHHHRFGDMALSFALENLETHAGVHLTNFGEYLERHPPTWEALLVEPSAWSCAHGVGRWKEDCGCASGAHPGWKQSWRAPLRRALDELRDAIVPDYEREAGKLFKDPWQARDEAIDLVLDRTPEAADRFLARHGRGNLDKDQHVRGLELLELQRQTLLMYASCGWFFDEISGIESIQVLRHAGRAIDLAGKLFGGDREERFLAGLALAPSNRPEYGDGRGVYEKEVRPIKATLADVAASHAAGLLFDAGDAPRGFAIETHDGERRERGSTRLATGMVRVVSKPTLEEGNFDFAFLHLGDHNLTGAVREASDAGGSQALRREILAAFERGDLALVLQLLEQRFGERVALDALAGNTRRQILDCVLEGTLEEAEASHRRLYDRHAPLMRYLEGLDTPPPRALAVAAEIVLNAGMRRALESPEPDADRIGALGEEARAAGVEIDRVGLGYAAERALGVIADRLGADPSRTADLTLLRRLTEIVRERPLETNLRRAENACYHLAREVLPRYRSAGSAGDRNATEWVRAFEELARTLRVALAE